MRKGSVNQFIDELETKIEQLKGVRSSTKISAATRKPKYWDTRFRVNVIDAYNKGELTTENIEEWETKYNAGIKPKKPLGTKDILDYYIAHLEEADSAEVVDDGTDVIEANDQSITSAEEIEDQNSEYLTGLYQSVEQELNDLAEGFSWNSDEDNIYLDVNFTDGHVFTFTIPKADLSYDIQNQGKDIEYICVAVRDTQPDAELEETFNEDKSLEEYDLPAYL